MGYLSGIGAKYRVLSEAIASSVCAGDHQSARATTRALLKELKTLETKYGSLPSILATRADYIRRISQRITLLERAWRQARKIEDKANLVFISSSLAEIFVEVVRSPEAGEKWLQRLGEALSVYWDDHEYQSFNRTAPGTRRS